MLRGVAWMGLANTTTCTRANSVFESVLPTCLITLLHCLCTQKSCTKTLKTVSIWENPGAGTSTVSDHLYTDELWYAEAAEEA